MRLSKWQGSNASKTQQQSLALLLSKKRLKALLVELGLYWDLVSRTFLLLPLKFKTHQKIKNPLNLPRPSGRSQTTSFLSSRRLTPSSRKNCRGKKRTKSLIQSLNKMNSRKSNSLKSTFKFSLISFLMPLPLTSWGSKIEKLTKTILLEAKVMMGQTFSFRLSKTSYS